MINTFVLMKLKNVFDMNYFILIVFLVGMSSSQLEAQGAQKRNQAMKVLEKSINYLSFDDTWNKQDDRECEDDFSKGSYSLYCALHKSQLEITGKYKHRGLVMKTIRKVIKSKVYRRYPHIIRDYNNLESTSLEDIKKVIKEAMLLIKK